ncbi:hypothetical protein PQR08_37015 [Caballeronia jiangsuensis]|uniref:Tetratricopeptide repeat protein n=1 Tax=Caballeronia jiangsuensis TaxID=1458357 RepID=A0ABW9D0S6_9BURK
MNHAPKRVLLFVVAIGVRFACAQQSAVATGGGSAINIQGNFNTVQIQVVNSDTLEILQKVSKKVGNTDVRISRLEAIAERNSKDVVKLNHQLVEKQRRLDESAHQLEDSRREAVKNEVETIGLRATAIDNVLTSARAPNSSDLARHAAAELQDGLLGPTMEFLANEEHTAVRIAESDKDRRALSYYKAALLARQQASLSSDPHQKIETYKRAMGYTPNDLRLNTELSFEQTRSGDYVGGFNTFRSKMSLVAAGMQERDTYFSREALVEYWLAAGQYATWHAGVAKDKQPATENWLVLIEFCRVMVERTSPTGGRNFWISKTEFYLYHRGNAFYYFDERPAAITALREVIKFHKEHLRSGQVDPDLLVAAYKSLANLYLKNNNRELYIASIREAIADMQTEVARAPLDDELFAYLLYFRNRLARLEMQTNLNGSIAISAETVRLAQGWKKHKIPDGSSASIEIVSAHYLLGNALERAGNRVGAAKACMSASEALDLDTPKNSQDKALLYASAKAYQCAAWNSDGEERINRYKATIVAYKRLMDNSTPSIGEISDLASSYGALGYYLSDYQNRYDEARAAYEEQVQTLLSCVQIAALADICRMKAITALLDLAQNQELFPLDQRRSFVVQASANLNAIDVNKADPELLEMIRKSLAITGSEILGVGSR